MHNNYTRTIIIDFREGAISNREIYKDNGLNAIAISKKRIYMLNASLAAK